MPKLLNKRPLDTGLAIGVVRQGKKSVNGVWYAHIYLPPIKPGDPTLNQYKSLKIKYMPNHSRNERDAEDAALRLFRPIQRKWERGEQDITRVITIRYALQEFDKWAYARTQTNERLIAAGQLPTLLTFGKKTYWTDSYYTQLFNNLGRLRDFFDQLPTQEMSKLTERDLNTFEEWAAITHPAWSPSTKNKYVTAITTLWRYAAAQGWVTHSIKVERTPPNLKARQARHMTVDEYNAIVDQARHRYKHAPNEYWSDLRYQFYLWIRIHAWCGIRPATGHVKKNLIKWSDVRYDERTDNRYLYRENEKGHPPYFALIHHESWRVWDDLEAFHKRHGTYDPDGYVFVHTHDGAERFTWIDDPVTGRRKAKLGESGGSYRRFKRGDPIFNFRTQWRNILKELELDVPKGTPRSKALSMYSLRHFFIQQELEKNPDLRLEDLASITGTSPYMIEATYYRADALKVFSQMSEDSKRRPRKIPIYDSKTGKYSHSIEPEE